jgi:nicotinamidase-related amidase
MKKVLIVVDAQNDFISGSLGSAAAAEATKLIRNKIDSLSDEDIVIFTRDTHDGNYATTLEGKKLPIFHCIKDTPGWEIADILKETSHYDDHPKVDKKTFGATFLHNTIFNIFGPNPDIEIEVCGFCTDICVISNVLHLRAHFPDTKITVLKDLCAGTTVENHKAALAVMNSCQIDIV